MSAGDSLVISPNATHEQAAEILAARRALVASILGPRTQQPTNAAEIPPNAPASASASASAQRDLTALAEVLPVLLGRASPIVRSPGGTPEGSPAELVQPLLGAAVRGLYRLAWLREHRPLDCLVLVLWWLLLGDDARVGVPVLLVDLVGGRGPARGPRAAKLDAHAEGMTILVAAEAAYARAPELACDARWLSGALEDAGRVLGAVRAARLAGGRTTARKAPSCATARVSSTPDVCDPQGEPCLAWTGTCVAVRGRRLCRSVPDVCTGRSGLYGCCPGRRWAVREGALVPSWREDVPYRATRESETWALLAVDNNRNP